MLNTFWVQLVQGQLQEVPLSGRTIELRVVRATHKGYAGPVPA